MTSDYRENLVIGLVKGVASGNITHRQLAGLYGGGQPATDGGGAGSGAGEGEEVAQDSNKAQQEVSLTQHAPYNNSETYQNILVWHEKLGIPQEDVLKVFTPNVNTINDTKDGATTLRDTAEIKQSETTLKQDFLKTRNTFPNLTFASSGVPLINTSLLYQMIRRNLTRDESTQPTNGDNPKAVDGEATPSLLPDTNYGGGEGSFETTTETPKDEVGGGEESLVGVDAGTTTNEELVTRTDSSAGISDNDAEDWANATKKKCYMTVSITCDSLK